MTQNTSNKMCVGTNNLCILWTKKYCFGLPKKGVTKSWLSVNLRSLVPMYHISSHIQTYFELKNHFSLKLTYHKPVATMKVKNIKQSFMLPEWIVDEHWKNLRVCSHFMCFSYWLLLLSLPLGSVLEKRKNEY